MNKTRISKSDCSCNISIELAEGEKPPIKCPNCGRLWSKKPNMNKTTEETMAEFDKKFIEGRWIADFIDGKPVYSKHIKQFFSKALDSKREETAEGICKLIDKIELSYRDTSLEEWKAFKHIRNAIRDKYFKTKNE